MGGGGGVEEARWAEARSGPPMMGAPTARLGSPPVARWAAPPTAAAAAAATAAAAALPDHC